MKNDIINSINKIIIEAKEKRLISTKDISDGYHTFGDLYAHRMTLFCVICNSYPELSWKSKRHFNEKDDPMFEGSFIAGVSTKLGDAIYHIKLDYWDEFNIPEIENAPVFDGHKSDEDLERLKSLCLQGKYGKKNKDFGIPINYNVGKDIKEVI